jgi:hypothetical protein
MRISRTIGCLTVLVMSGVLSVNALAQAPGGGGAPPAGGNGQDNGGGRGNRGPRDMTSFRQAMTERLKTELGATDDEFKVLQPKIEKIQQLERDMQTSRYSGMRRGRGGNRGGANGNQANQPGQPAQPGQAGGTQPQQSDVAAKTAELQKLLEDKDAKPDEIKAKLQALRDAKTKAKEELTKAQAELKELLSARQEAVLVSSGVLE